MPKTSQFTETASMKRRPIQAIFAFAFLSLLGALLPQTTLAATIANPSNLQVNLGPVPLDYYDQLHRWSNYFGNNGLSCPPNASVQGCYQAVLPNWYAQKVRGVRFMFYYCGGGYSTPLTTCG